MTSGGSLPSLLPALDSSQPPPAELDGLTSAASVDAQFSEETLLAQDIAWNEEFQRILDLPARDAEERFQREAAARTYAYF